MMVKTKWPGIYRRNDRYVAIVTYRDAFGRKRQKWLPPQSALAAAKDARRHFLDDLEKGLRPDGSRMTLAAFARDVWLPDAEGRLTRSTVKGYRSLLERHVLPEIGQVKLKDVSRDHLRRLYAGIPSDPLRTRTHACLSSLFSYAVKDVGALAVNPCLGIRRPRYSPDEAPHLDPEQTVAVLDAAVGDELEGAILLGLAGGLRVAEAIVVTWGDIEADGTLTVRSSYWGQTKNRSVRSLALPSSAYQRLLRFKRTQAERLLSVGIRQGASTPVVADALGRPMHIRAFERAFGRFCKERNLRITFHAFRHSNTVAMLLGGVDVKTAASRLGNTPAVLLRTYAHYIRAGDRIAAEQLDRALSANPSANPRPRRSGSSRSIQVHAQAADQGE